MSTPVLYPLNDLGFTVPLKKIDTDSASATFGKAIALTTGTVTAFLATSDLPTAAAADATLVATCTHVANGKWLIHFDGAALTASLLNTHFAAATPYMIVQVSGDIRVAVTLEYQAARPASVG